MYRILIVDDEEQVRRPLSRLLRQEGYTVITAADALQAMAAVNRGQPDLILLDVGIPPMDGLTFLLLLRQGPHGGLPVILVTGMSDEHTVERARELGCRGHLVKSNYTAEQLLELIRRNLPSSAGSEVSAAPYPLADAEGSDWLALQNRTGQSGMT